MFAIWGTGKKKVPSPCVYVHGCRVSGRHARVVGTKRTMLLKMFKRDTRRRDKERGGGCKRERDRGRERERDKKGKNQNKRTTLILSTCAIFYLLSRLRKEKFFFSFLTALIFFFFFFFFFFFCTIKLRRY